MPATRVRPIRRTSYGDGRSAVATVGRGRHRVVPFEGGPVMKKLFRWPAVATAFASGAHRGRLVAGSDGCDAVVSQRRCSIGAGMRPRRSSPVGRRPVPRCCWGSCTSRSRTLWPGWDTAGRSGSPYDPIGRRLPRPRSPLRRTTYCRLAYPAPGLDGTYADYLAGVPDGGRRLAGSRWAGPWPPPYSRGARETAWATQCRTCSAPPGPGVWEPTAADATRGHRADPGQAAGAALPCAVPALVDRMR